MLLDITLPVGFLHKTDYIFIKLLLLVFPYFVAKGIVQHHVIVFRLVAGDTVCHRLSVSCLRHIHTEEVIDQAALPHTGSAGHQDAGLLHIFTDLVQQFIIIKIL